MDRVRHFSGRPARVTEVPWHCRHDFLAQPGGGSYFDVWTQTRPVQILRPCPEPWLFHANLKEMMEIDGSYGEGGGQLLRTAVALAEFFRAD